MSKELPATVGGGVYNVHTGKEDPAVPAFALLGLRPPRFCATCGRKMAVQVRPNGWWAKCSRHGETDSTELDNWK